MSNELYAFHEGKIEKPDVRLLYITHARDGVDWHSTAHTHHFTELFYITRGCGYFLIENQKIPVKKDDLIMINPNVSHTEMGDKIGGRREPMEYIALGANGFFFTNKDSQVPYSYGIHHFQNHRAEFCFYLDTLLREVKNKEEHFDVVCQDLLEALILTIMRRTKQDLSVAPNQKITKECRFVEQYIDEHFREDITLRTLSDLTYLNKYYLVHSFKRYKGVSPISYLISKRVQEARHLLETTNHPVSKIAAMTGFSSQSYFSQTFKRETGMTPNQYRFTVETNNI